MFASLMLQPVRQRAVNDPYSLIPPVPYVTGGQSDALEVSWWNTNGKTRVDLSTLVNPVVILQLGQSLSTNCVGNGGADTYVSTNTGYNFSITDGGLYVANGTLLGCTGYHPNLPGNPWPTGSWLTRLIDKIHARTTRPVILVPFGIGGSNVRDWQLGGANFPRFAVVAKRLANVGLTPSCVYWQQGESNYGDTQSAYATPLASVITDGIRAQWATVPILIALSSYINDLTDANVRAAQAAAVNNPAGIYAGADGDSLTFSGGYRQTDKTHWNPTGALAYAALADTSMHNAGVY